MFKKILLTYFVFLSACAYGQYPFNLSFTHLTREKGLSNTNIISMLRDSRGFVWMASLNGLNRFDGTNVKIYKPFNSNIKGNYINKLIEDKNGIMWLGTNEGLSYYDRLKDDFIHFPGPIKNKTYGALPNFIDKDGLVWVLITQTDGTALYTFNPKTKEYNLISKNQPKFLADMPLNQNRAVAYIYSSNGKGIQKLSLGDNKVIKTESFLNGKNGLPNLENVNSHFFVENDSTIWLTNSTHGLSKFNPKNFKYTSYLYFQNKKLFALNSIVPYGNYLFICGNDGIFIFDKTSNSFVQNLPHSPFNSQSIAANWVEYLYIDRSDNLFCSLFGNGVDFTNLKKQKAENIFPVETASSIGLTSNAVYRILKKGDNILLKMQQGGTVEIDKNGTIIGEVRNSGQPIFVDEKQRYWTTQNSEKNKLLIFNKNLKLEKSIDPRPLFNWFSFYGQGVDLGSDKYLISNVDGIFEYAENKAEWTSVLNQTQIGKPINTFHYEKSNKLVFVSSNWWNQFHIFENKANKWALKYKLKFNFNVFCIKPAQKPNYIWLGTDKGLVSFNFKSLKYSIVSEKDGLPDDAIGDIIEEKNGDYWLNSNKGIAYFNKAKNSFREFTSIDGADSKDYNGNQNFKLADSSVIFGGNNGVTRILGNLPSTQTVGSIPTLEFTNLTANEKPVKTPKYIGESTSIELQADQNSFAINFVAIDYTQPSSLRLKYRLVGIDKEWILSKNPAEARYSEVKEGNYNFEVQVFDQNNAKVANKNLEIRLLAPFYRTSWFRILMAAILVSVAYFFFKLRSDQIRNESEKKEQIRRIRAESEINALRSQMNPHFIFNCLNTVDSYILLNKTDEASKFLNKFSKLVRMILENSRQDFIPLQQDLRALELYIDLEKVRSNPSFESSIDIDPACNESTFYIPSTIIQPFVENAILHGLRHKTNGTAKLKLQIKKEGQSIAIHLIDNGIGREASAKINKEKIRDKTSVGVDITQERINKLNELYPGKASLTVIDIIENKEMGTHVHICLPLLTIENIQI
jgi:ligand-binding sensor domain-containing protein